MIGSDTVDQVFEPLEQEAFVKLLQIGASLSSMDDIEQLLEIVVKTAAELTDTEFASLFLLDKASRKFYVAASNNPDLDPDTAIPLKGSIAGWIFGKKQNLVIEEDTIENYNPLFHVGDITVRNLLGVPLIFKERVIGVLEVANKDQGQFFVKWDELFLESLASQAAVAIENTHLYQQTELVSEFMHEIKTPLMAITSASELLARETMGGKEFELVDMIQVETKRLAKMAQDFLDLARLESGRTQLAKQHVNIHQLIEEVVRIQKPQAINCQIEIHTVMPEQIPFVVGDYDRLKQVFLNLVSNAVKYNEEQGTVTIRVSLIEDEVEIEVADSGPGIAKENLPHLFERFYRIPDSEGFTQGTGLGLSIAARILQEHGGRIEVESEVGKGSVFRCLLPR